METQSGGAAGSVAREAGLPREWVSGRSLLARQITRERVSSVLVCPAAAAANRSVCSNVRMVVVPSRPLRLRRCTA